MNLKRKLYMLLLATLPLGAHGCKKEQMFPENNEGYNHDTTEIVNPNQPNVPHWPGHNEQPEFNYDTVVTISWNWKYFRCGPHGDHVRTYCLDPNRHYLVHLLPDTTELSVRGASELNKEWWMRVYDTLAEFSYYCSNGMVSYEDAFIKIKHIITSPDDYRPGIDEATKQNLERLGFTVIETCEKGPIISKKHFPSKTPAMPWNTALSMVHSKNTTELFDKTIDLRLHDFVRGLADDHVKLYINNPNCRSITVNLDSSWGSIVAMREFGPNDWNALSNVFNSQVAMSNGKLRFVGCIYYGPNRMPEYAKNIFMQLGLTLEEVPFDKKLTPSTQFTRTLPRKILENAR